MSRDKVIALLWPESTTAEARHLLSVSVHAIRKEVGEDAIRTLGDDLRLDANCLTADVWDFERALLAGNYARAIDLYAGPFLDGVYISGADEFGKWTDDERADVTNRYTDALERAAHACGQSGDYVRAVELWRKRSQLDPYQGRVALEYMRAMAAAGDRAGAIQHARLYSNLLRSEIGTEPEPAILRLAEELKTQPGSGWILPAPPAAVPGEPGAETAPDISLARFRGQRPTRLRRFVTAANVRRLTIAAGIAGAALVAWFLGPEAPLDPNRIVGYPLRDLEAIGGDNPRGEEVAVAIGSALELTDQIKWIDGWTILRPTERSDPRAVALDRQMELARRNRARYAIGGQLFDDNNRTTVRLVAYDVANDSVVAEASESGSHTMESAVTLSIRALNKMLPRLLASGGRGTIDLTTGDLTRHPPAALAAWLRAEREYRSAHYQQALDHLSRALTIDSTLGIAALRAATAANWIPRPDTAHVLVQRALANPATLSGRQLAFARGLLNSLEGRADSALAHYRDALRSEPLWSEAHMAVGEVYHYSFPATESPDSLAERSFALAADNDPDFAPPLYYLTHYALLRGDTKKADEYIRRYGATAHDSSHLAVLQLMRDCARSGAEGVDWNGVIGKYPNSVYEAVRLLSVGGAHLDCAEAGYRALLTAPNLSRPEVFHWAAVQGLSAIYGATGRYAELRRVLNEGLLLGLPATHGLAIVAATNGAPLDDMARQALGTIAGPLERQYAAVLWYRGAWYARQGSIDTLAAIVSHLDVRLQARSDRLTRLVADGLRARLLLARADTASALVQLKTLRPNAPRASLTNMPFEALAQERIMLARLLLAKRQYVEALRAAETFDRPQPDWYLPHLGESLRIRISAARALDLQERARRYEARLHRLELLGAPSSQGNPKGG
jgi:DNA-binding SARP family transcriptional activator